MTRDCLALTLSVLFALGGCGIHEKNSDNSKMDNRDAVQVIHRFFAKNPIDRVEIRILFLKADGGWRILGNSSSVESRQWIDALQHHSLPIEEDTSNIRFASMAQHVLVQFEGPECALQVWLDDFGFGLANGGRFVNIPLAAELRSLLRSEGLLGQSAGLYGHYLEGILRKAEGKDRWDHPVL